jgi:hypothetical protein
LSERLIVIVTVFTRFIRARGLPFAKLRRAHKNCSVSGHFVENRFLRARIPGFVGENRVDVASRVDGGVAISDALRGSPLN